MKAYIFHKYGIRLIVNDDWKNILAIFNFVEMKLSVITINFNNKVGLERTFNSVFSQTYRHFEYIVIDGGSSDGSKDLLEKYEDKLTYWISEPDTGIYNAMNKGIKRAKGEYLLFLNSGDSLVVDVLQKAINELDGTDIIYGNWYWTDQGKVIHQDIFPDKITFIFLAYHYSLPHQASFIKKELFEKFELYDESLRMVSDWKFFLLAIFKWNCNYRHINLFISYYDKTGFSSNPKNDPIQMSERKQVMDSHFKNFDHLYDNWKELENYRSSRAIRILKKTRLFKF